MLVARPTLACHRCGSADLRLAAEYFEPDYQLYLATVVCRRCARVMLDRRRPTQSRPYDQKGPLRMAKTERGRRRPSPIDRKLTRPTKPAHRVNTHRANGAASTSTEVAPKGRRVKRGPRSQTLPGLEAVRLTALDHICEGIGECRDKMNTARTEEKQLLASALQTMQKKDLSAYRHARVELARIPGAERLRVRVTGEDGDAAQETADSDEHVEVTDIMDPVDDGELRPGVVQEHDGQ